MERLIRTFKETLEKIDLCEMSASRKHCVMYLSSQAKPFARHICKIMLWGNQNEEWLKDWSDEIFNYLDNVADMTVKGGSGRLKEKDYREYFFDYQIGSARELDSRLAATINICTQKDGYPRPLHKSSPREDYEKYQRFIDRVIYSVLRNNLDYQQILDSCKELASEN